MKNNVGVENIINRTIRKVLTEMINEENPFGTAVKELNTNGISIDDLTLLDTYGLTSVTLSKRGSYVTLTDFVVKERNGGYGTRFMNDLTRVADENGWVLVLTPDDTFGASSVSRLKKFYKRFGFQENKGRNADFGTRESMIRRPMR